MVTQHSDGTVEFAFYRPGARSVRVAGDFNYWDPGAHELAGDDAGWWRLRVAVPAGDYRFKYLVDGRQWETDYAACGVEPDKLGGWNAILTVEDTAALTHTRIELEIGDLAAAAIDRPAPAYTPRSSPRRAA